MRSIIIRLLLFLSLFLISTWCFPLRQYRQNGFALADWRLEHKYLATKSSSVLNNNLARSPKNLLLCFNQLLTIVIQHINNVFVGLIFAFILRVRNSFTVKRKNILLTNVFSRPTNQGLLTVSNHQSMLDDPGIWASILPFWRLPPHKLRWSLCTDDVYFAVRVIYINNPQFY